MANDNARRSAPTGLTASEVIAELRKVPGDAVVLVHMHNGEGSVPVEMVANQVRPDGSAIVWIEGVQ